MAKFSMLALGAAALLPTTLGLSLSVSAQVFIELGDILGPKACAPSGYYQSEDLGSTNRNDLMTHCRAKCNSFGDNCQSYVGELRAAVDSNIVVGACFYYSTPPTGPRYCSDCPTSILAEIKDNTPACFSRSPTVATPYCSSYLSIGTVTVYTSTITPSTVETITTTSLKSKTKTKTKTKSLRGTPIIKIPSMTTSCTETTPPQITTIPTSTTTVCEEQRSIEKRLEIDAGIVIALAPSCLDCQRVPPSVISSACSCLSITSKTISTVLTLPTHTKVKTVGTTITCTVTKTITTTSSDVGTTTDSVTVTTSTCTSTSLSTSTSTSTSTTSSTPTTLCTSTTNSPVVTSSTTSTSCTDKTTTPTVTKPSATPSAMCGVRGTGLLSVQLELDAELGLSTAQCHDICRKNPKCASFYRRNAITVAGLITAPSVCTFFSVSVSGSLLSILGAPSTYGYDCNCPASSYVA